MIMTEYILPLKPLVSADEYRALEMVSETGSHNLSLMLTQIVAHHSDPAVQAEAQNQLDLLGA